MMEPQNKLSSVDASVIISDHTLLQKIGNAALLGSHFLFLTPDWYNRSGLLELIAPRVDPSIQEPIIMFRGKRWIHLAGMQIAPSTLPDLPLVSLSCDKQLYRSHHDTVRLLVAAPLVHDTRQTLQLFLNEAHYADYIVNLDHSGLALWSIQDLPEGIYKARIDGVEMDACRFEVAEYRLAPLNVELVSQELQANTLHFELAVTTFQQPCTAQIEVELQEQGRRVGRRFKLACDQQGRFEGRVRLEGEGPFSLNVFVKDRTATVALKASEKPRREMLTISELGAVQVLSLLPMPGAEAVRGMFVGKGGQNTAPFQVQRLIGQEVVVTPRVAIDALSLVVVDPQHDKIIETSYSHLKANEPLHVQTSGPYALVFLGAVLDGRCWEGWCAVLNPSSLQLECQAPQEARPGEQIKIRLKTALTERPVPIQLIVKDQRVVAPTDPQVEFAARVKGSLAKWSSQSYTGYVEREVASVIRPHLYRRTAFAMGQAPMMAMSDERVRGITLPSGGQVLMPQSMAMPEAPVQSGVLSPAPLELPRVRMQFPEVVFNQLVRVEGEAEVEVKLGEGLGRYTVEAFALDRESLDWQRVETSFEVTQPLAGELTVAPFVLPGDAVSGRLDILSAHGEAIAEVRVNGQSVPLFLEDGSAVAQGQELPSGTSLRFPLQPGQVTAIVRSLIDPGLVDVSERLVMEMGKLRHIARRTRLLLPDMEVTVSEPRVLEILPLPGFEHSFESFVQAACENPYGCVEQTCSMLLAQFTGYLYYSQKQPEKAHTYENAIVAWHKRLRSMELPKGGFSLYPSEQVRSAKPDSHYAPLAMKHLQKLPAPEQVEFSSEPMKALLQDLHAIRRRGMAYYELQPVPQQIRDCEDAYLILKDSDSSDGLKTRAANFIREVLQEKDGQVSVNLEKLRARMKPDWYGKAVLERYQTAFAAASLLILNLGDDMAKAISATNYLLGQMNEQGRFYSTVDTAAGLVLFVALRGAGIAIDQPEKTGRVVVNGREIGLEEALKSTERVESLRCVSGLVTARVTSEVIEDWRTFKSDLPVEVRLEKQGQVAQEFEVGDELDLVIKVPHYEAGLLAHICLPDALARVVGGGQVKRFSLDFSEQSTLKIPLAVVGSTVPLAQSTEQTQHWAVIVRNMFKEEQIGNPGLLELQVR